MAHEPDLSAVLKTLSSFAQPRSTPAISPRNHQHLQPHLHDPANHHSQPRLSSRSNQNYGDHRSPVQLPPAQQAELDPSTITTWSAALKHVMRTVSVNEELQTRIRRLIQSQYDHEKQWWKGREALLTKQKTRWEKKKQLQEVLKSVGAPISLLSSGSNITTIDEQATLKENKDELTLYDNKVYKASTHMSQVMEGELRGMGIPFFCLKSGLIDNPVGGSDNVNRQGIMAHTTATTIKLTTQDVIDLKKKILELLLDLCKE